MTMKKLSRLYFMTQFSTWSLHLSPETDFFFIFCCSPSVFANVQIHCVERKSIESHNTIKSRELIVRLRWLLIFKYNSECLLSMEKVVELESQYGRNTNPEERISTLSVI